MRLTPDAKFAINEVLPIELSALQRGSGIGAAAMPLADGTQRALEVRVTAQVRDGQPVATRALAGRNGFTPPM